MKHGEKNEKLNLSNNWKILGGLFLSMLLIFTMVASAETEGSSAGASASADGDITITNSQATVTENSATASATARATASNGGIATAIAEAWANFLDRATAYARATSTATAGIDETVWVEASVEVSALEDGTANSKAESIVCIGENCLDKKDGNNGNNNPSDIGTTTSTSIGGGAVYIFGKSDVERYCHFKSQLTDNDISNDARADYYINITTWGNGFYEMETNEFENKYNITCSSSQLDLKDSLKDRI